MLEKLTVADENMDGCVTKAEMKSVFKHHAKVGMPRMEDTARQGLIDRSTFDVR